MSLQKMLGLILVVVFCMFSLMFSTSYAWYSYNNASTKFEVATNNEDVLVSYLRGEYIATNVGVPILKSDVDRYSEKNNFIIRVKDNVLDNDMVVNVSLIDISIDSSLRNSNFKIDLYYQGKSVASVSGDYIDSDTMDIANVTLDSDVDNSFELRVYLLDDGSDQSSMMNKSFKAKINLNVVSRLKTEFTDFKDTDINIKSITIDGKKSDNIPINGYYKMDYVCSKGSKITWDSLSKTITYGKGAISKDVCELTFTSDNNYPKLSDMDIGSYVKYVGNNGCSGKACYGENANYVSDNDMGYCGSANNKFISNGWRIAYIDSGSVYLISGGSPECSTDNLNLDSISLKYCNKDYIYNGECSNSSIWNMKSIDFKNITGTDINNCIGNSSNKLCGYTNDLIFNGGYYWFSNSLYSNNSSIINSNNGDYGIRPIIRLKNNIVVTGGSGKYDDPYTILVK